MACRLVTADSSLCECGFAHVLACQPHITGPERSCFSQYYVQLSLRDQRSTSAGNLGGIANRPQAVMGDTFRTSDLIDTRDARPCLPLQADVSCDTIV